MAETINLNTVTSVEQLNALVAAAEARKEQIKREGLRQLRQNLRTVARDMGLSLRALCDMLVTETEQQEAPRTRRPSDEVAAEKLEAAKKMKYFDPVSKTGWTGMGRAPHAFRDAQSGTVDRKFLEACRNPDYAGDWTRSDAAE